MSEFSGLVGRDAAVGGRVLADHLKASVGFVFQVPSFVFSAWTSHLRCATLSVEMLAATRPWTAAPHPVDPEYPTLQSFRRERYIYVSGDTRVCWQHKKLNCWWRLMHVTNSTYELSALIVRVNIIDDSSCSSVTIFLHYKYHRAVAFREIISACKFAVWESTELLPVSWCLTCRIVTRMVQRVNNLDWSYSVNLATTFACIDVIDSQWGDIWGDTRQKLEVSGHRSQGLT